MLADAIGFTKEQARVPMPLLAKSVLQGNRSNGVFVPASMSVSLLLSRNLPAGRGCAGSGRQPRGSLSKGHSPAVPTLCRFQANSVHSVGAEGHCLSASNRAVATSGPSGAPGCSQTREPEGCLHLAE